MAKLHFYYSAMNAGKTTTLLQSSYNYRERGMATVLFKPKIDQRVTGNRIGSRIGLEAPAVLFDGQFDFLQTLQQHTPVPACVFVDEAQFLTKAQVYQLTQVVDKLSIPVLAYGLRSDFLGEPFEGSKYLLAWADKLIEIKTICYCGKKAIMNVRVDAQGRPLREGAQVEIGGNERYVATCRRHFQEDLPLEILPIVEKHGT